MLRTLDAGGGIVSRNNNDIQYQMSPSNLKISLVAVNYSLVGRVVVGEY